MVNKSQILDPAASAHNDCWCSQLKSVQSGSQLQAPVIVSSVCGTEEGKREELPEVAAKKEMW